MEGKKRTLFAIPMVWRALISHLEDCYICLMKMLGFQDAVNIKIEYPYIPSLIKSALHKEDLSTPVPLAKCKEVSVLSEEEEDCMKGQFG
jgi:hypothetical protein